MKNACCLSNRRRVGRRLVSPNPHSAIRNPQFPPRPRANPLPGSEVLPTEPLHPFFGGESIMFEPYQRGGREGPPRNDLEYWCRPLPGFRHPDRHPASQQPPGRTNRRHVAPRLERPHSSRSLRRVHRLCFFDVSLGPGRPQRPLRSSPLGLGAEQRRRRPAPRGGPRPVLPRSVAAG